MTAAPDPVQWYYGTGNGTSTAFMTNVVTWLMQGIMYAGPKLTPQTFKQGHFAAPASGGATSGSGLNAQAGYGRTNGLPYDEYLRGNKDFALVWWDPDTVGPQVGSVPGGLGASWYVDSGKRYHAGFVADQDDQVLRQVELEVPARGSAAECTGPRAGSLQRVPQRDRARRTFGVVVAVVCSDGHPEGSVDNRWRCSAVDCDDLTGDG